MMLRANLAYAVPVLLGTITGLVYLVSPGSPKAATSAAATAAAAATTTTRTSMTPEASTTTAITGSQRTELDENEANPQQNKEVPRISEERIDAIRQLCGEVCEFKEPKPDKGHMYGLVRKDVNCRNIFEIGKYEEAETEPPPRKIPEYLREFYTYDNRVRISEHYMDNSNGNEHLLIWKKDFVDSQMLRAQNGTLRGSYSAGPVKRILQAFRDKEVPLSPNMTALVIGSQRPWVEATLLAAGVSHITTLDYVPIKSLHPNIRTITPQILADEYLNGKIARYNLIVSFSSLEHSGLGRYGDQLNPWGDLIMMAQAWCVAKPGAYGLIGVPAGPDVNCFNVHKLYGPVMYSQLFANWRVRKNYITDVQKQKVLNIPCMALNIQPLHVIQRIDD